MEKVPTVKMYKGQELLVCNESDCARFEADGWSTLKVAATPAEEPAAEAPVAEAPAAEKPKAKKR
jgi:hypothetical protein